MLTQIRQLCVDGKRQEVLAIAPSQLEAYTGDDRAKVHLYISTAYFETTRSRQDWERSIYHAESAREIANPDGFVYVWSLQKLASIYVNSRRYEEAAQCAHRFLELVDKHTNLAFLTPIVWLALSHVEYSRRNYAESARLRLQALNTFEASGDESLANRVRLNLVWAYIKQGNAAQARFYLYTCSLPENDVLKLGARAAYASLLGDWSSVITHGRKALHGGRNGWDYGDAADVCLLMMKAATQLGMFASALEFWRTAVRSAAMQSDTTYIALPTSFLWGGGVFAEATAHGYRGYHAGACFTTGIA